MLVITRRPGESIIIETSAGELIEVMVVGINGNQVQLGTEAPADVVILREGLLDRERGRYTLPAGHTAV